MKRIICLFKDFFRHYGAIALLLSVCLVAHGQAVRSLQLENMDSVEISLLTCEPHDEVYSLYGHSAVRITDKSNGLDIAVNWGMFDFSSDNFVLRFVFGLTDYMMGISPFQYFVEEYKYYGVAVIQQRLNMTSQEKQVFMRLIYENAKPENVVYRYNFFYNNCTTKARETILKAMEGEAVFAPTKQSDEEITFRQLIHSKNVAHPWARFGNDILLGIGCDRNTSRSEREFLPEILMKDFASAKIKTAEGNERMLVDSTFYVLTSTQSADCHPFFFSFPPTPLGCAIIYLFLALGLVIGERRKGKSFPWLRYILILPFPISGIVLTAMLFSEHPTVSANLQILICNPLLFYLAFPKAKFKYCQHIIILLCLLFFLGNIFQTYAEGMNIMAIALLLGTITSGNIRNNHTVRILKH